MLNFFKRLSDPLGHAQFNTDIDTLISKAAEAGARAAIESMQAKKAGIITGMADAIDDASRDAFAKPARRKNKKRKRPSARPKPGTNTLRVLELIESRPGIRQQSIVYATGLPCRTVGGLVVDLEKRRFIRKEQVWWAGKRTQNTWTAIRKAPRK